MFFTIFFDDFQTVDISTFRIYLRISVAAIGDSGKKRALPFYVLGEVNQPGSYPHVSNITAISLAGGFTARAKRSAMTISRSDDDSGRGIDVTAEILLGDRRRLIIVAEYGQQPGLPKW